MGDQDKPDYVSEKGYPVSVRKLLNWCKTQLDRAKSIKYGEVSDPQWENRGDNQEIITLPSGWSGNLTVCVDNGEEADPRYTQKTATYVQGQLKSVE